MIRALASRWIPFAAAGLAIAVHAGTLGAGFVYDDFPYIVENPDLRGDWSRAPQLFASSFPSAAPERALYRPLTAWTLFVDAHPAPLDPFRFHATNLVLAAGAVLAVHALLKRMLPAAAAGAGALLFAVHPVHVEAIAWVTGRSEVLAGILVCVALALALDAARGGSAARAAAAGGALALGVLAKESAAAGVPLAALLLAADARSRRSRAAPSDAPRATAGWSRIVAGALFVSVVGMLLVRHAVLGRFAPAAGDRIVEGGLLDRLPLALAAGGEHVRLLIAPWPLSIERMPDPPGSWSDPRVVAGVALLLALAALVIVFARRGRIDRAVLAAWPAVALLPVSHLVPIGESVAERFLFLPSVGVAGLVGSLLADVEPRARLARFAPALLAALLLAGAAASWTRSMVWKDERTLWEDALRHDERSPAPWAALGDVELRAGNVRPAIARYEGALARDPALTVARLNLARALDAAGDPAGALAQSREAVRLDPAHPVAWNHLGARLARAGTHDEARAAFDRAVEIAPRYAPALVNAARAALEAGDAARARDLVRRARLADPTLPGLDEIERGAGSGS